MRNTDKSGELNAAAEAAGVSVDVRQLDVDDPASVQRCIDGVLADKERIDLLINNAGIGFFNAWEQAPMAEIEQHFQTNFFGAVRCALAVLPAMRSQGSGAIVNVSSVAARLGLPVQGPYCATKAALASFSESLAIELRAQGIRVFNVMPGFNPEGSPYAALVGRWQALYAQGKTVAVDPVVVSEVIDQALANTDTIHWLSGPDSAPFVEGWARIGDAGRLAYGDTQTDEEWFGRFMTDFPIA